MGLQTPTTGDVRQLEPVAGVGIGAGQFVAGALDQRRRLFE
jgi:hypothetical protein